MSTSLVELGTQWNDYDRRRATGGLNALSGFAYQLAVSLEEFIDRAKRGDADAAIAFETLSDVAEQEGDRYYLIQVKATLTSGTAVTVAEEALAVDAFLVECHPELRERFSYAVHCRAWTSGDPRTVTAKSLKLTGAEADRWEVVKTRISAPVVRPDPRLRLALRLFPQVDDPFRLVAEMTGELLGLLAAREIAAVIAERLLLLLSAARSRLQVEPPQRIVGAEDFVAVAGVSGITLGQQPTLGRLNAGMFMSRAGRIEELVDQVEEELALAADEDGVTVCWLSGGSGVGKSVLLLQILEELARRDGPVLHHLNPTDTALEAALDYWRKPESQVVVAVDDLFAPARRADVQWDRLIDKAMHPSRTRAMVVLTAGPRNYLEAFTQRVRQSEAFRIHELPVAGLQSVELAEYRAWFEHRTGVTPPPLDESLFVVAALRAVAARDEGLSIAQFADRFRDRSREMGIEDAVRVALAMNRFGIPAPEQFFEGRTAQLADLIKEDVVVIQESGGGQRRLMVFHQQVAGVLYDNMVPAERTEEQALDLAAAFHGCGDDPVSAAAVITGPATGTEEERRIVRRVLERTWTDVCERAADAEQTPAVAAWMFAARAAGLPLAEEPYRDRLVQLIAPGTPGSIVRPVAIVAATALQAARGDLLAALDAWLVAYPDDPSWPEVAVEGLRRGLALGVVETWLESHVSTPGSAAVFLALPETSRVRSALLDAILDEAPPIARDRRLWQAARAAGVPDDRLIGIVIRRAVDAPNDRVIRRAAAFLADMAGDEDAELVAGLLREQRGSPNLTRLLRATSFAVPEHTPLADAIVRVGIEVLQRVPDSADWPATWHAMYSRSGASQDVLRALGREWLIANPTRGGWFTIANNIVPRTSTALDRDWSELFRDGAGDRDDAICRATAEHLAADLTSYGWWRLATGLLRADPSPEHREIARQWLRESPHSRGWPFVWEALCSDRLEPEDAVLGRDWLADERRHPSRNRVRNRLRVVRRTPAADT